MISNLLRGATNIFGASLLLMVSIICFVGVYVMDYSGKDNSGEMVFVVVLLSLGGVAALIARGMFPFRKSSHAAGTAFLLSTLASLVFVFSVAYELINRHFS